MGVLFLTWLVFAVLTGDQRPQVLDLLLGSIGGVWFAMVVKDQGRRDEERNSRTESRVSRTAERVDQLEAKVHGDEPPRAGPDDG